MREPQADLKAVRFGRLGALLALGLLLGVAYAPVYDAELVNWDDEALFLDETEWRGLGGEQIERAFTTFRMGHWMPLTWLSHGLDYALWGMDAGAWHMMNVAWQAVATIVLVGMLGTLFRRIGWSWWASLWAAWLTGALWVLHPLRVENIAWVTERRDLVSAVFLFGALWAWLGWTRRGGVGLYLLAVGLLGMSLLGKAWGMTFPVLLMLLDGWPLRRLGRSWAGGANDFWPWLGALLVGIGKRLPEKIPFFLLAAGAAWAAFHAQAEVAMVDTARHPLEARLMQAFYGLAWYPWKTLVPTGLSPLHLLPLDFNPWAWPQILAAVMVVAVTVTVLLLARRQPAPLMAWMVYGLTVAPVLGLAQSGPQMVADRYAYLATLPLLMLAVGGWLSCVKGLRKELPGKLLAGALLFFLGFLTTRQAAVWQNSGTLWSHAIEVEERNHFAWNNRGLWLREAGRLRAAEAHFSRAVELYPRLVDSLYNRGNVRVRLGDLAGAEADFTEALRYRPHYLDALLNRGNLYRSLGSWGEAAADYEHARRIAPRDPRPRNNLGVLLESQGRQAEALAVFEAVLADHPENLTALENAAAILLRRGLLERAEVFIAQALALAPERAIGHYHRGLLLMAEGDASGARTAYDAALQRDPRHLEARINRANLRRADGDLTGAESDLSIALRWDAGNLLALYNRALVRWERGNRPGAREDARRALEKAPTDWVGRPLLEQLAKTAGG